jgi:transposase
MSKGIVKTPSRECSHVLRYGDNLGGVFELATIFSYPLKMKKHPRDPLNNE